MAYFYFDFRDVDKQQVHNLHPSLLIQLSACSDPCCDIPSQLYSSHDRGVQKPSDRAMIECLKEMLTLESQGPTYITMDALDECPITTTIPSPREEVLEFARILLECGARIDVLDNTYHRTVLHCAVVRGNIQAVRLLLKHGADVIVRDGQGKTPSQAMKQQDIVKTTVRVWCQVCKVVSAAMYFQHRR